MSYNFTTLVRTVLIYIGVALGTTAVTHGALQAASISRTLTYTAPASYETSALEGIAVEEVSVAPTTIETVYPHVVPFYSQFADITPSEWRGVSCGVASLAMLIDYYKPAVTPDTLLQAGLARGAYIHSAGWSHAGLITLAQDYGLTGASVSLSHLDHQAAFTALKKELQNGPVMVSVHYTFQPTNPIPHLAVITGIVDEQVHYNDPAELTGGGVISTEQFQSAWKKRYIKIRPATS